MLYNIIIKSKTSMLDRTFTYSFPEKIERGSRVIVPFGKGNTLTLGFVLSQNETDIDTDKIKEIVELVDSKPILNDDQVDLVEFMVDNYLSDYSSAIQALMPAGGIDRVEEYFSLGLNGDQLTEEERMFFKKQRTFKEIQEYFPNSYTRSKLNDLVDGLVLYRDYSKLKKAAIRYKHFISLVEDASLPSNAKAQQRIVDYLLEHRESEKKVLLEDTKTSLNSLKALYEKGLIEVRKEEEYREVLEDKVDPSSWVELNEDQQEAINTILNSDKRNFLIHGVTGSGKTEVYLNLVKEYISKGKEAIILVPEISLTPQTIQRFQSRFGKDIAVMHSKLSINERYDQWRLIKQKKVKIVVGARSAIFAPFENLGLIVIDEEHETSYKSDKNPKYSAIDIAVERSKFFNAKLVLGTATPSIDSMYKAYKKEFELIRLNKRATNSQLPQVDIVDMREELLHENFSMFSNLLKERMENALARKQQVILFLNKRGHTSYVFCRSCGYVHKCEACDVSMTYHKHSDLLVCHFCGRTNKRKKVCLNCGSSYIKEFGAGTEKLEEETKKLFPDKRIFRMDADTITNKRDYDRVYNMMVNREIDILIGTQMLAKGLDFPGVTVVGVMAADLSLNLPDYKSSEKTYQLITQVSGRAGRGDDKGYVVLQTYKPDNFAIQTSSKNNYYEFFKYEIEKRKRFSYPPFQNILIINCSSKTRQKAIGMTRKIISMLMDYRRDHSINIKELTGPTPSVIEKINNYYRYNVIVKSENLEDVLKLGRHIKNNLEKKNDIYINYSINPDSVY